MNYELRNPKYSAAGIDCEILHPVYGWLPFTATATGDAVVVDVYQRALLMSPAPADPAPIIVPQSVTMRQARLALLGAGMLPTVEAALDALSEPQRTAARIEWDYSNEVQRTHPFVQMLGGALGMTSGQLDNLFIQAGQL
jgi:hypothetical protein